MVDCHISVKWKRFLLSSFHVHCSLPILLSHPSLTSFPSLPSLVLLLSIHAHSCFLFFPYLPFTLLSPSPSFFFLIPPSLSPFHLTSSLRSLFTSSSSSPPFSPFFPFSPLVLLSPSLSLPTQPPSLSIYQTGKGILRVMRFYDYGKVDIVPVDLVNNMLICVGWITGVNPTPQPIIYQCSSGTLNPMNWIRFCKCWYTYVCCIMNKQINVLV